MKQINPCVYNILGSVGNHATYTSYIIISKSAVQYQILFVKVTIKYILLINVMFPAQIIESLSYSRGCSAIPLPANGMMYELCEIKSILKVKSVICEKVTLNMKYGDVTISHITEISHLAEICFTFNGNFRKFHISGVTNLACQHNVDLVAFIIIGGSKMLLT